MGKEVETTEEPEAAYLRGVVRRISAILERMREPGSWNLSTEAAIGEIDTAVKAAMKRPATNGIVIDELYKKIGELEGAAIDHGLNAKLLRTASAERAQVVQINGNLQAEVASLRSQLANAVAVQSGAINMEDDARAFLAKLGEQLVFLAQHHAPLQPEIAQSWSDRLVALSGRAKP